jgi:hypothetical protein
VVRDRVRTLLPTPRVARNARAVAKAYGCDRVWFGAAAPPPGRWRDGSDCRPWRPRALVVSEAAVVKHVGSIFTKLDLHQTPDDHRRVPAVLTYLRGVRP